MKSPIFVSINLIYQLIKGKPISASAAYNPEKIEIIANTIFLNIIFVTALMLIAIFIYKKKRAWFIKVVIILTFVDLFLFSKGNMITIPFSIFKKETQAEKWLKNNLNHSRFFSTSGNVAYTGLGVYWTHLRAREPFSPNEITYKELQSFDKLTSVLSTFPENQLMSHKLFDVAGYAAAIPKSYVDFWGISQSSPNTIHFSNVLDEKLNIAGVKYIVTDAKQDFIKNTDAQQLKKVFESDEVEIFENPKAWPRAFLVEGENMKPAEILSYESSKITIKTKNNKSSILVLTDSIYPGWKVFVDGKIKTIQSYQNTFRSVKLSEGEHVVKFVFDPLSVKLGAIISMITAILLVTPLLWKIKLSSQSLSSITTAKKTH